MENLVKKTAVIYCRVSTKDQVQNTSLESQERYGRDYAHKLGVDVARVFVDEGESAKTTDRPKFLDAVSFCQNKKNRVEYFIVYKMDRFSRKVEDQIAYISLLRKAGVLLRSCTENIDETPPGKFIRIITGAAAEFDNDQRAERTKGGMHERVKQGIWVWLSPVGYYRPTGSKNIEPDPESAPLITQAFEEYSKGTHTFKSIAKYISDRGLHTRKGNRPGPQLMEKILRNPLYMGVMRVWGEDWPGSFSPIVSEHTFNLCQDKRHSSSHTGPRTNNNPDYPLRKILSCQECGAPISGSKSRGRQGKGYSYYHHSTVGCSLRGYIPKETLEQQFVKFLESITPSKGCFDLFRAIVLDLWDSNYRKIEQVNTKINSDIQVLELQRHKIFENHQLGKYTDEEFLEQKSLVNKKIEQKRLLLQDTSVKEMDMESALDYCYRFISNSTKVWLGSDFYTKVRLQNHIFQDRLMFDGKVFGNTKLSPIYQISQEYDGNKSSLVDRG